MKRTIRWLLFVVVIAAAGYYGWQKYDGNRQAAEAAQKRAAQRPASAQAHVREFEQKLGLSIAAKHEPRDEHRRDKANGVTEGATSEESASEGRHAPIVRR